MEELKACTRCSCAETKQNCDTGAISPLLFGSNLQSTPATASNSSAVSSSNNVFASSSPTPVADSGASFSFSGKNPLFGEAALTDANTSAATSNGICNAPLGQWSKGTAAKDGVSTSSPPWQSNPFRFNTSQPSYTPAFSLPNTENKIHNHGWKPGSNDKSSDQGIFSLASFLKSTGMNSHPETSSFCFGPFPPSTSHESKPSHSEPFSFTSSMVGQGAESNSLFEKPKFSFGKSETSAPGTHLCANCGGPTASTNSAFLTQYPMEGLCSIVSISATPINKSKSHEELRLEHYLSQGKVKKQDDMASEVIPYPVYPFIPIMMQPTTVMLPLIPNFNPAFNVASSATSTGFPAGPYPLFYSSGVPCTHGPPIPMLAIDPNRSVTNKKS